MTQREIAQAWRLFSRFRYAGTDGEGARAWTLLRKLLVEAANRHPRTSEETQK